MISKEDLIKIAITAAFAAFARELFTALIGGGKTAFSALKKKTPAWIARYRRAAEFAATTGFFVFWVLVFIAKTFDTEPITYAGVRSLFLYALCTVLMFSSSLASLVRWRRYHDNLKRGGNGEEQETEPPVHQMKLGEIEFTLTAGQNYHQGTFRFDAPFHETPHVFISECVGGNWLVVKIDAKDEHGFQWAVTRAFPAQAGPYNVRLQWLAITPGLVSSATVPGLLSIDSALYGVNGVNAVLTTILRAKVKNDSLDGTSGNALGGDPCYGAGKMLVVEYTYRGQKSVIRVAENHPFKLP